VEECLKIGATLSHEDQITLLHDEEVKKLEQQNITLRYYALPEINVATNEAYDELRHMHDEVRQGFYVTYIFLSAKTCYVASSHLWTPCYDFDNPF
jgi:hypothetical protein